MISDQTLAFGSEVLTAVLGVDALYRLENEDEDGLAVLNMDTKGEFKPDPYTSYGDAKERFNQLKAKAVDLPEADRRKYYDQMCTSTLAFIKWREEGLPFTSQLSDFIHVPAQPASDAELDGLRKQMRALLNQMGYDGDLKAQCAAWEDRNKVPADEIQDVLKERMDEAWDRTEKYLFEIPAPRSDGMEVVAVSGASFNARCNYLERKVELNTDPVLTRPTLKHLTVHEGYPGHYVQFKMREVGYKQGTAPADGLISVVNTASSSTFEGIADAGLEMLNWIESDDDRLSILMGHYRAGIGTGAAWRLNALGWSYEKVEEWLRSQSLAGGEGWVSNRMGFISAPSRAVLIWTYWWGEQHVAPAWRNAPIERRPEFLRFLYGRMHSNDSVAMFK